jgi:hypothetical protein
MNRKEIRRIVGPFLIGLTIVCSAGTALTSTAEARIAETVEIENGEIDWEEFDTSSTIAKTAIKIENLQGLWKAYKGLFRFGEKVNSMQLTKPMIMEVKDDTYRRNPEGEFEKFSIRDNLIIKATETKTDTGIINKITSTELTISWKNKSNYTRYYYTK